MKIKDINNLDIKVGIICKSVKEQKIRADINEKHIPIAGDVAIFRVLTLGKHTRIQTESGRNTVILPGDLIMGAFGSRYATSQIEGYVPNSYLESYDILGQGGVIGQAKSWHLNYDLVGTTKVELIGYVVNENGQVVNTIKNFEPLQTFDPISFLDSPKTILSLGTSMDSGKTSSAAFLAYGLKKAGKTVAFIKLTGTTYTKDKNFVEDYGAHDTIDFSDFGFPSTYMCETEVLLDLYQSLLTKMVNSVNPDYVIVEIADGLLERETNALLKHSAFKSQFQGAIFSASGSLSGIAGAKQLEDFGITVIGISGLVTTSPLLVEEIRQNSKYSVLLMEDLMSEKIIHIIDKKHILNNCDQVEIY